MIDSNDKTTTERYDSIMGVCTEVKIDIKDLRLELYKVKDKTDDKITSVRIDLEDKFEMVDARIRNLEIGRPKT